MLKQLSLVALFTFVLCLVESPVSAEEKEIDLPKLPAGAGKVDKDAPKTFSTTKSGLKYRVLRKGTGAMPKASNEVNVNYEGWLEGGKVFDSSYKRGEPISFPLDGVNEI